MTAGQVKSNGSACDPADDQLLALFLALASSPHEPVEVIETHAARVYLVGSKAYKIKKRVKLPYLDFSSLEARQRMLLRELELNRGHAPEIYIGVMPICRADDGSLALGHDGEIIDYALVMNRFEQDSVLARVAGSGPLSPPLSRALAEMVAAYHRSAAIAGDADGAGIMLAIIAQLADELADAKGATTESAAARFRDLSFQELGAISSLLNRRGSSGHVRRCHGDLHLGNIVLLSGRPVPFDALEFDERLATIDVLYDLAFLIMDLDFRGDRAAANLVLNSYVGAAPVGGELDGLKCLPLFLATRAAIRAVVASQRARQQPVAKSADDARAAERYLNAANTYLKPPRPSLVAVGGLSGTGKSTLAAALAPHIGPAPGALHLRSDVERKRHFGVAETERLTAQHYSEAISETVYRIVLEKAECALKAGHAVIIDAVAAKRSERDQMATLAQRTGAVFAGLWLECPFETMVERVAARHGDASDADAAVVAAQSHYDIGEVTWAVIDARGAPADLLEAARTQLRSAGLIS